MAAPPTLKSRVSLTSTRVAGAVPVCEMRELSKPAADRTGMKFVVGCKLPPPAGGAKATTVPPGPTPRYDPCASVPATAVVNDICEGPAAPGAPGEPVSPRGIEKLSTRFCGVPACVTFAFEPGP